MLKIMIFQTIYLSLNNPNPMTILLMVISFTLTLSLMSFMITMNYWMSILIIITYIGGLMILFLYVISLLPNSKQKWSNFNKMTMTIMIMAITWLNLNTFMIKSPLKTISMSYFNNLWSLMFIMLMILLMAQMASKIIFLPFKMMKSTY